MAAELDETTDYKELATRYQVPVAAVINCAARTKSCLMSDARGNPQMVYTNLEDAANFLVQYQEVPREYAIRSIIGAIATGRICCGHIFSLVSNNSVNVSPADPRQFVPRDQRLVPVQNVETGQCFDNALEAAQSCGRTSATYILKCCQGTRPTVYGYH